MTPWTATVTVPTPSSSAPAITANGDAAVENPMAPWAPAATAFPGSCCDGGGGGGAGPAGNQYELQFNAGGTPPVFGASPRFIFDGIGWCELQSSFNIDTLGGSYGYYVDSVQFATSSSIATNKIDLTNIATVGTTGGNPLIDFTGGGPTLSITASYFQLGIAGVQPAIFAECGPGRMGIFNNSPTYTLDVGGDTRILGNQVGGRSPLNIQNLPTSATALLSGDVWNNGGVLNIVP